MGMDPEVTADNTIAIGVIIGITDVTGITDLSRPTEGTIPIKVETTIIEASHRDRRDHVHRDWDSNHGPRGDGGQHHRDSGDHRDHGRDRDYRSQSANRRNSAYQSRNKYY